MHRVITGAVLTFLLAFLAVSLDHPSDGQEHQLPAEAAGSSPNAKQDQEAPAKETKKHESVCSADFALPSRHQRDALLAQLRSNPTSINRLYSLAGPGGPGDTAPPDNTAIPLKLGDIQTLKTKEEPSLENRHTLAVQHQRIALIWGQKWPNGSTLHVRFLNTNQSWTPIKKKIADYARQWEQYANITFAFDDSPTAQIRILLTNDNFSWSMIGTDAQTVASNNETMHFGWFNLETPDEEYSRTVIHEFGHALGAIHEHQHPDAGIPWNKQSVYDYYASAQPPWTKDDVDVNMFKKYDRSILQYGAYDKDSIMHYPIPPTFTTNGFSIGWNTKLSAEDKAVLAWVYPKPH
jgi:serralysin